MINSLNQWYLIRWFVQQTIKLTPGVSLPTFCHFSSLSFAADSSSSIPSSSKESRPLAQPLLNNGTCYKLNKFKVKWNKEVIAEVFQLAFKLTFQISSWFSSFHLLFSLVFLTSRWLSRFTTGISVFPLFSSFPAGFPAGFPDLKPAVWFPAGFHLFF